MGKREADLDGIEYYYDPNHVWRGGRGCLVYIVPCCRCGRKVKRAVYGRKKEFICDACSLGLKHKKQAAVDDLINQIETKNERRFNQALDEMQRQIKNFDSYDKAIKAAKRAQEKYGSIPEAMVAIELLHLGYKIIPQQKVRGYRVDFFIPEQRFVVEVDGKTFHKGDQYSEREAVVQFALGLDVKIIHVSAELIRNDIQKLGEYIDRSLKLP